MLSQINIIPLVGALVVLISALIIKLSFKRREKINLTRLNPHPKATAGRPSAVYRPYRFVPTTLLILSVFVGIGWEAWSLSQGHHIDFRPFYLIFGTALIAQLIMAISNSPFLYDKHVDDMHVAVMVPVYNEDQHSLRECLEAILEQSRLPEEIHVVDDDSSETYTDLKRWFLKEAQLKNIKASWSKIKKQGKRAAHMQAMSKISEHGENMVVVTIDSDSTLDYKAIEEGLKPFADDHIQSVAGVVVAKNANTNLLSRITDILFVSWQQLIDRSAMSRVGSVIVNSGGLAFYRYDVVKTAIDHGYIDETFFGRTVAFSDDSYLTLFALLRGHTVQQPTAIVFADMPIKLDHHVRQQLRWMRGSFIRGWWRLRYLPMFSWGFARQLFGWMIMVTNSTILVYLLLYLPIFGDRMPPVQLAFIPLILGFVQAIRYLAIVRSDMTHLQQAGVFILAPIAALWSVIILRTLRIYGIATCLKTDWGTRSQVEVVREKTTALS
jgi:hyaluronan synthase